MRTEEDDSDLAYLESKLGLNNDKAKNKLQKELQGDGLDCKLLTALKLHKHGCSLIYWKFCCFWIVFLEGLDESENFEDIDEDDEADEITHNDQDDIDLSAAESTFFFLNIILCAIGHVALIIFLFFNCCSDESDESSEETNELAEVSDQEQLIQEETSDQQNRADEDEEIKRLEEKLEQLKQKKKQNQSNKKDDQNSSQNIIDEKQVELQENQEEYKDAKSAQKQDNDEGEPQNIGLHLELYIDTNFPIWYQISLQHFENLWTYWCYICDRCVQIRASIFAWETRVSRFQ